MVTICPRMVEVDGELVILAQARCGQGEWTNGDDSTSAMDLMLQHLRDDPQTDLDLTNLDEMVPWCESCETSTFEDREDQWCPTCFHEIIWLEKDDVPC